MSTPSGTCPQEQKKKGSWYGTYQSKRQLQPALSAAGKLLQSLWVWMPPYRSPQPFDGAPYWLVQAASC